jgi:ferric enterobactin receptor
MKRFFLFLVFAFFYSITICQTKTVGQPGLNNITGKVKDVSTKQPIEYATITLFADKTTQLVNGTITDKKGLFNLQNIKPGRYTIAVEFLGYSKSVITGLVLSDSLLATTLDDVLLEKKLNTLQDVTVTGTRQTIENKIDKLVFNVEKDLTSQGGVATDALKKIPGVTVDVDGKVELLGNSSIRFLIDGKPSGLFGNSVADALQSIPNSQIQSIEVITSPSAKYDASGTGGIINIILKKNKVQGFNGNINIATGTRIENGSINLGYKKSKLGVNAFFSGNAQLESDAPSGMDRLTNNQLTNYKTQLTQQSDAFFNRDSYNAGVGMDYEMSKNDHLSASLTLHHFANRSNGNTSQLLTLLDDAGNVLAATSSLSIYDNQFSVNTFDNLLSYTRKFKKEKQMLEIGYSGSFSHNNTFYDQYQVYKKGESPFSGSNSLNPGRENEVNISIDYAHPLDKDILLETGFKTTLQSIISNADVFTLNAAGGNYVKDLVQSYSSDYRRTIYAGYGAATFSLLNYLEVKGGLRYEYTVSNATYSNAQNVAIPDYTNLAPSVLIAHNFPNNQSLKFGYSYRLERPDYRDLNPFMNLADPHNITTGNPNLQPEIGHNYQLSYNRTFESGANLNVMVYQQRNIPDIKPYITYYPSYQIGDSTYTDVTLTTRANISSEKRTGVNISASVPVGKKINVRTNTMIFNRHLRNDNATPAITNSFGYRVNLNVSYQFDKNFIAEGFGNYNSGMRWQGRQPASYAYTLAFRKQLWKNKASFGVVAVNAFNKYINQNGVQTANNVTINNYRKIPYRSFGFSFTYKFGKLKFAKQKEADNYLYSPPAEN